jgi:predicted ATPase
MVARRPVAAAPHIDALVELGQAHKMPMFQVFGSFLQPWSRPSASDAATRLAAMRSGIATIRANGIGLHLPVIATALAEDEAQAGEPEAALATVDGVIADSEGSGQRWFTAETHRIRGEILLKRDPVDVAAAEKAFLTAIAIAQRQKARSFELRGAVSMARLWRDQGKRDEARELLAPVYGWFNEDFDTMDLKEAKALLDKLHA